ncbi:MAG TPA: PorV/PorQ family protein, partial [candidate division Zixibacteria bacterium]|nr:PorV/PorQ family protein [candidate division Zixibacteria bacterium]
DDATTTHWNPAGLGAYPLADGWTVARVPADLLPLKAIAAVKQGGGSDYTAYEIWAISGPKGLVRFDNRAWHTGEEFSTRTDQTVRGIVASYFKVQDEDLLNQMVARVARANAEMSREELALLRDSILAALPEGYRDTEFLTQRLDSVMTAYDEVRLRWPNVQEARKALRDGLDDGALSSGEADKLSVAIERARMRFIPEEVTIPYTVVFDGEPTAIAAKEKLLVVGTSEGLFTYDGKSWRTFTEKDGLPSDEIRSLHASGAQFFVGTAEGLVMFTGRDIAAVDTTGTLPAGYVSAIGADGTSRVWAVIDGKLYRYDGASWSRGRAYTIAVGDTLEKIAERFALYGTASERQSLVDLIKELNPRGPQAPAAAAAAAPAQGEPLDITKLAEMAADTAAADSAAPAAETAAAGEAATAEEAPAAESGGEPDWANLPPGDVLILPFAVEIKGNVNSIAARQDELFLGTDFGLLYFDGEKWRMPGWSEYTAPQNQTVEDVLGQRAATNGEARERYLLAIREVNGIESTVDSGAAIRIPQNALAAKVNLVRQRGASVYFATAEGLRVLEDGRVQRIDEKGMGEANTIYMDAVEDELWLASDREIVIKANGRKEFSLMHVNWLPELASDMYYDFIAGVFQVGDVGTAGFNVTYLTYGEITNTNSLGQVIGSFRSFDVAVTGSFGFPVSQKLKVGVSAKLIHSHLSDVGTEKEKGSGTSTGVAADLGLLYQWTPRLNIGLAITNLGPDVIYIDAAQADPLPRNLAVGLAYKVLHTDYYTFLVTAEMNKMLVGIDLSSVKDEISSAIFNGGVEFSYANLIAGRAGYIYDQEGQVKAVTLGAGLKPLDWLRADFSYIPSSKESVLDNTLRFSLSIVP